MKYIALLRGVNISGKNKIVMSKLKEVLEKNNYQNVTTHLNSGNVIFETSLNKKENITKNIYEIIKDNFMLEIPVFVLNEIELEDILNNAPDWWKTDNKEIYDNLIFIMPPTDYQDVYDEVGLPSEGIDKIEVYNNSIYWSFDLKSYRKSNWWIKTAITNIKDRITIRTANTMRKILAMCKEKK